MFSDNNDPFARIQSIANNIRKDVEKSLGQTFNTWDVDTTDFSVPEGENVHYRMKVKTDDNGHVRLKTVEKEPGHDYDVHVEEYEKGDRAHAHVIDSHIPSDAKAIGNEKL